MKAAVLCPEDADAETNGMRTCGKCGLDKTLSEYGRYRLRGNVRWRLHCKKCRNEEQKSRYSSSPETQERMKATAKRQMLAKYGLTVESLQAAKEVQEFRCAACSLERPLCVDHDHRTGLVRGLLCKQCNFAIGSLGDSPERMVAAARYVDLHTRATAFCRELRDALRSNEPIAVHTVMAKLAIVVTSDIGAQSTVEAGVTNAWRARGRQARLEISE
jgi:hypothetical protein